MAQSEPSPRWTIESILRWATDDFRSRGLESPRLDAEVLLAHALATSRIQLVIDGKRPLVGDELSAFRDLVRRRRSREPVAYLLGKREFYGRTFLVDRRVLIPRPDTETLVTVALERTRRRSLCMRALDLCTGSGCVAITLGRERPTSHVLGLDQSAEALEVARTNALRLGAYQVGFVQGDLFAPVDPRCRFDVITANPPYIASSELHELAPDIRNFEPRLALDGGADGLELLTRIVAHAGAFLAEEGALAVEIAAGQAERVLALFDAHGYVDVSVARDYGRIERVVSGVLMPAR